MYLLELSNHKESREGIGNSIASNESGGGYKIDKYMLCYLT